MTDLSANIAKVRARIQHATEQFGRLPGEVLLVAVSKTRPAGDIEAAYRTAGQIHFGENYAQEAATKLTALTHLPLCWHFIGPLQSNKTRLVAEHFDWLHSLDRLKVAERLQAQRPASLPPLNTCIQLNIDGQATKSGMAPDALPGFLAAIASFDRLAVRGLMVVPDPARSPAETLASFRATAACLRAMRVQFPTLPLDTLSMGMSGDLELAIAAGSTVVRIGTDIFGPR